MTKFQKILTGILAAQILLVVLVFITSQPAGATNNPLLGDFEPTSVSRIIIEDNNSNQITLEKIGTEWVLPNAGNYPATSTTINDVLEKLASVRDTRPVTQTSSSHQRLEVSENSYQRKINLLANGKEIIVYLGSSPAPGGVHIRAGSSDTAYLTNALTTSQFPATASNWIETTYWQIATEKIQSIKITNPNGSYNFALDTNGVWKSGQLADDEQLDDTKWASLLSAFATVRMVEPVGTENNAAYGLDSATASLEIDYLDDTGAAKNAALFIGSQDESAANYYAQSSLSAYIVKLSQSTVDKILNFNKDSYTANPTPTVTP